MRVSSKLDVVDKKIDEKSREMAQTPRGSLTQSQLKEELGKLEGGRERLRTQRQVLDCKLHDGALLTPQEERR